MVLYGFLLLIFYVCSLTTTYISNRAGGKGKYLKAAFRVKPRTNLAISYIYLVRDYPELKGSIEIIGNLIRELIRSSRSSLSRKYQVEIPIFDYTGITGTSRGGDKKQSLTIFYRHKLDVLTTIATLNDELRDIIEQSNVYDYKCKEDEKEMLQIEFIINNFKPKILITYFTLLKAEMMTFDIINPVSVVKISIPDKNKIGDDCYLLDNYIYSYIEGRDRELVDLLVSDSVIKIEGEYVYSGQPPVLEYPIIDGTRVLCSNFREELFEWIPENSNVIVEIRSASILTRDKYERVIKIEDLPNFIASSLTDLYDTFKNTIESIK